MLLTFLLTALKWLSVANVSYLSCLTWLQIFNLRIAYLTAVKPAAEIWRSSYLIQVPLILPHDTEYHFNILDYQTSLNFHVTGALEFTNPEQNNSNSNLNDCFTSGLLKYR